MIDQLVKLVQQNAGDAIVNNNAVPNQFNNAAIQSVAQQIFSGLQSGAAQGNVQQVTSLFNGASVSSLASNPMVTQMISKVAGDFAAKFGVSPQTAQTIAAGLIPQVMNQFVNKTNDPNDSDFDLQDMLRGFTGNSGMNLGDVAGQGGIGSVLGKILG
ncbi:DUF937 domain-containing protein [Chryseolinea sp. T2]|uniref:DUF937 domain-containing protein n=1 Tax=Chryseolinea sp. T2 TaxID=3129255 RepID=UPI0030777443